MAATMADRLREAHARLADGTATDADWYFVHDGDPCAYCGKTR